ncbi:MAG: DUF2283 domain-containing protein [Chloroflexi bacterium]|nr:DUF2283 domain-containing protein [Chloroflexota bacterium]
MKIQYDYEVDALYIGLADAPGPFRNETFDGPDFRLIFDIDERGKLVGIEMLDASVHLDLARLPLARRVRRGPRDRRNEANASTPSRPYAGTPYATTAGAPRSRGPGRGVLRAGYRC